MSGVRLSRLILFETIERFDRSLADNLKSSPRVISQLGRGFESTGFLFDTKDGKWVMKVGLPKNSVSGLYSPATEQYATTMLWNYKTLNDAYLDKLPNLIPSPYFVLPPGELSQQTTIQIQPFIEKTLIDQLTNSQKEDLIAERHEFHKASCDMLKNKKVMPDLVRSKNLIVGQVSGIPHYILVDIGLFHLEAPTPILNLLVRFSQKLSLKRDINSLKLGQKRRSEKLSKA